MRLDLSSVGIPLNTEVFNKLARNVQPVFFRECNLVSVQVTSRAIELALRHDSFQIVDLKLKSICEIGELLSHRRRCGALTVSPAKHGHLCVVIS